MPRYIDADKLRDEYYELFIHGTMAVKSVLGIFVDLLDKQPTVDVKEVKHGKWIKKTNQTLIPVTYDETGEPVLHSYIYYECNLCGKTEWHNEEPYCHCGAKMTE